MLRKITVASWFGACLALCSYAQTLNVPISGNLANLVPPANNCTGKSGLACVMPNIYGPRGLVLPNSTYAARFDSSFQSAFWALNSAIATQITLLPVASPASGFTFEFDRSTGVYRRSSQTFGPVLTERAETIGKHKIFIAGTFQRFRFDTIDGKPLHNWPAVFTHVAGTGPNGAAEPYETQFITTNNSLDLKVNQFTFFATYGVTNHFDVSVAVPFVQIGMNAASYATINRTVGTEPALVNGVLQPCCSSGPPYANYFDPANPATSLTHTFSNSQYGTAAASVNNLYGDPSRHDAEGLGDVIFRFKDNLYHGERMSLSLLTDLRLPTGDAMNLLGSGAIGWKPFMALSVRTGPVTPHVNAGYQWNGQSILGGNLITGTKDNLPGYAFWSAGADYGVFRRLTVAADYIGQELINAPRIGVTTYTSQLPLVTTGKVETFGSAAPVTNQTYNQSNLAIGVKASVIGQFVVAGNLLVALNDGGLRQKVVPLIGLSYTF